MIASPTETIRDTYPRRVEDTLRWDGSHGVCLQRFVMWHLTRCAVDSHRLGKEVNDHVGHDLASTSEAVLWQHASRDMSAPEARLDTFEGHLDEQNKIRIYGERVQGLIFFALTNYRYIPHMGRPMIPLSASQLYHCR